MSGPARFQRLEIGNWRQFDQVVINLHPHVTIITGANGAGKSTILNLFSRHFGWDRPYIATPSIGSDGALKYLPGFLLKTIRLFSGSPDPNVEVGNLQYSNGHRARLLVPKQTGHAYHVNVENQHHVDGVHILSHRVLSHYQPVQNIPTTITTADVAFNNYRSEVHQRHQGGHTSFSPIYRLKESLIAMATFGEGNSRVQSNPAILNTYIGFVETLKKVLPETIGFIDLEIRVPDVVLITRSGEWSIDAASGGILALIDVAWQLYLKSQTTSSFVATIDEPENHLHPSMQRSLLTDLVSAFPNVQFIIATHSPFIVTSVKESAVYVLKFSSIDGASASSESISPQSDTVRVRGIQLDTVNKAGSASEILRDVLGVPATIPIWVEKSLTEIVDKYRTTDITPATLQRLRTELKSLGYDDLYPQALAELMKGK